MHTIRLASVVLSLATLALYVISVAFTTIICFSKNSGISIRQGMITVAIPRSLWFRDDQADYQVPGVSVHLTRWLRFGVRIPGVWNRMNYAEYEAPLWIPLVVSMAVTISLKRRRHKHGVCTRCGYDLRGLPEPRCPECGLPFELSDGP